MYRKQGERIAKYRFSERIEVFVEKLGGSEEMGGLLGKMGYFEGFTLIDGGFWAKQGVFSGEMREKGCLMSGAAARTGSFNNKQEEKAYKIVMAVEYLKSNTQRTIYKTWKLEVGYQDRKYEKREQGIVYMGSMGCQGLYALQKYRKSRLQLRK